MKNNTKTNLWDKTFESYELYNKGEKGGSLFCIIMINLLLSNTTKAVQLLKDRIKNFKITNIPAENVNTAVSLLWGATSRLKSVKDSTPGDHSNYYEKLTRHITKVFQTTSVEPFNAKFALIEHTQFIDSVTKQTSKKSKHNYTTLFQIAETSYHEMMDTSTWTGVTTKGEESVFMNELKGTNNANKSKGGEDKDCWNC